VRARATAVDGYDGVAHQPDILPAEAVEHLVLRDGPNREAWLAPPSDLFAGRYWKDVTIHWRSLLKALGLTARPSASPLGRKRDLQPEHLEALRQKAFELLDHHGGLNDNDPDFRSKEQLIGALLSFAASKDKMFAKVPGRTTLQPHVDEWLEAWKEQKNRSVHQS
jgi:hypothetical protein